MHDFQRIALGERGVGKRRTRHDHPVTLDRDLFYVEAERGDEVSDAALAHLPLFAVEDDRDHWGIRLALPFAEQPI